MTFLPIVERELRVAARQPLAFLLRFFATPAATLFWLTLPGARSPTTTPAEVGQTFFNVASIFLFVGCAFSGVFLTADAISSEKRHGTLGLLFLTDLRGFRRTVRAGVEFQEKPWEWLEPMDRQTVVAQGPA